MLFWLLAALLTAAVVAFILRPLLSSRIATGSAMARARSFRAILASLARDEKAGLLANAETDSARADIARALIAEVEGVPVTQTAAAPVPPEPRARGLALFVAGFVTFGALSIYLANGSPELARHGAVQTARPADFASLVEELKRKVAERPADAEGQRFLGRGLSELGRYGEAAEAYGRALKLGQDSAQIYADYAEALALAAGRVTPEAKEAFAQALARDKTEPRARYYLALAKSEAGDLEGALDDWQKLFDESPADAPWRAVLARHIAAARQALEAQVKSEETTVPPAP
jgi:cytochrome c-type biogenesis protein CcmH